MLVSKYNASGNDFVIFHTFKDTDYSQEAIKLCNRQSGIGADGLIVLVPYDDKNIDFKWLFYNSDGSLADMCGNGSRACALYASQNNLTISNQNISFLTGAGKISCRVDNDIVQTQLTPPKYIKEQFSEHNLDWVIIDTGVPHLVAIVDDLELYSKNIASDMRYRYNANVNFAKVEKDNISVRTYERGVEDETLACGTGMAASFLRARELNLVKDKAYLYPKSGEKLNLSIDNDIVYFEGLVQYIFSTTIKV
jgi:diaminopimelate epimerase